MDASVSDRVFLDSNVIAYAFDSRDTAKQIRALSLLRESPASLVLSAQVLGEFYWTVTRKLAEPLAPQVAQAAVDDFARLIVVAIDRELVRGAVALAVSAQIAYWDALIVRAASSAGCRVLLTEDLNHTQVIDGVRIENPFVDLQ